MSFFSGLSNIFHGIGNFFDGGDDDPLKKKQQSQFNQPAPISHAPVASQQQQNNNPGAVIQPQKQDPFVNLFQPNGNTGLTKAPAAPQNIPAPAPAPAPPPPAPAQPHASIIHDITHNPITDIAGSLVKLPVQASENFSNTFANLGNKLGGGQDQTIEQNMGGDPLNDRLVKWSGATGQNKQLLGDTAQIGLTALAPGIDNVIGDATGAAVDKFLPSLSDIAAENLTKYGSRFLTGGTVNTGFSGASELGAGESTSDVLKKSPKNFLVGGTLNEAVPLALGGLRKFTGKMISAVRGDPNVPAPDELATGVKSANPTQAADAAKTHAENAPQPAAPIVDDNTPAYQRGYGSPQETPQDLYKAEQSAARKSATTTGQTYDAGLDPNNPNDAVPAFQRRGATPPAETQTNVAELQKQLDTMPKPEESRSIVFELKKKYGEMLRQNPEMGPAIRQHLDAAVKAANKVAETRSKVQAQLDDLTLGTASPDIRFNMPAASEPAPTAAENLQPAVAPEAAPAGPAVPTPSVPAEAAPSQPVAAPIQTPVEPALAPVQPPVAPELPREPSGTPANPGIKNARFNQTIIDATKNPAMKAALEEAAADKETAPLAQLNEQAILGVQKMSLPELVQHYGQDFTDHSAITNPQQLYEHLEAMRQLDQLPDDPTAKAANANALRAINDYANRSGVGTRAMQLAYNDLPTTMKVAYIQKMVQKLGGDLPESEIKRLYSAADLQGQFAKTAQEAEQAVNELSTNANKSVPGFNDQMAKVLSAEKTAYDNLYEQNRVVVDLINKNLPKSDLGTRTAQSARTAMLSSIGGRVFAMTGTLFNAANEVADKSLSAGFGKVINAVRGDNGVKSASPRPGTLVKGAVTGFKGLAKEVSGKAPVKNLEKSIADSTGRTKSFDSEYSHDTTRYGPLGAVTTPLRKGVRFAVGSHLAATKGIEVSSLEQAARQSAKDIGVPKENMQGYVDYYKTHPPKVVADSARQDWLGVNNLHRNGVSDALSTAAGGLEKLGGKAGSAGGFIAKQIRTVAIPFSHYMGGFANKMVTDRNLFYNAYRIARARSPQELADQLAHATTNIGAAGGLGYLLAKNGVITDKDQDGNTYDGLYFHVGDKYIGVAWAGQAAMPIIMGARLQMDGANGDLTKWPTNVASDALKATGIAGTFGASPVSNALQGNTDKAAPALAGAAVQQHIPGFTGDINAVLNQTSLDPTHEKPLTKATSLNPATGRQNTNVTQTEVNKTKALIPGLSQKLPRQTGEAAPTELDRMLHASEASGAQVQKAKDDKVAADQATFDKQNDIPNPAKGAYAGTGDSYTGALEARIEAGEFDKASQGLQQELNQVKNDKNVPQGAKDKISNKIAQLGVAKDNKLSYADMKLYNSTNLSDWRKMGDSANDAYDPTTYQKLWAIDEALAKKGVAGGFLIGEAKNVPSDKQKYSAKAVGSGSSRSRSSRATSLVKGNTIGSTPELKSVSFGNLAPVKIDNFKIPTIQQIPADQLVKKRAISITKA